VTMRLWFYLKDGQQKGTGPIAEDILLKMFSTGALSVDTLVWTSGMGEWKAARDVEVLSPSGLKQSKQPLANNQNIVIKTVPVKARSVAIVKRELEASYTSMFQMMLGCSSSEAREMFEDMFESAKTNALQSGEIELPENYGDIRLEMGLQDKNLQKKFSMLKKDGVRDDDIRWWGNMCKFRPISNTNSDFNRTLIPVITER